MACHRTFAHRTRIYLYLSTCHYFDLKILFTDSLMIRDFDLFLVENTV